MKRVIDKTYNMYSAYTAITSKIYVKCPRCHGLGIVTASYDAAYFKCTSCGSAAIKDCTLYRYDVHNKCKNCGRHYRLDITEKSKQHFHMLHVACPFCGYVMSGEVNKTARTLHCFEEIRDAHEPFFDFELWFLTYFKNKPVWAVNREHLNYLIDYLSADLRVKPAGHKTTKTQADHLPTFMKTAKNRKRIVKLLKDMKEK